VEVLPAVANADVITPQAQAVTIALTMPKENIRMLSLNVLIVAVRRDLLKEIVFVYHHWR
jgi:hypothetical protein